jgi:predicted extracellular nuclease
VRSSEVQRHEQAAVVNDFVGKLLASDKKANVVVLGDINDFEFSGPDWLALLSFSGLAIFQGMLMWALAGRLNLRPLPIGRSFGGRRAVIAGRLAGGVLVLAASLGFVGAVADILTYS